MKLRYIWNTLKTLVHWDDMFSVVFRNLNVAAKENGSATKVRENGMVLATQAVQDDNRPRIIPHDLLSLSLFTVAIMNNDEGLLSSEF